MDTQQMINKIYEKYADKTLSLWCLYISEITKKTEVYDWTIWNNYIRAIIWHPITLARVLSVLDTSRKNWHIETHQYKDWSFLIFTDKSNMPVCGRKLLNENWSDATLDDQSDETIQAIYNILFPTT